MRSATHRRSSGRPAADLDAELPSDLPPAVDGERIAALLDVGVDPRRPARCARRTGHLGAHPVRRWLSGGRSERGSATAAPPVLYGAGEPELLEPRTASASSARANRPPTPPTSLGPWRRGRRRAEPRRELGRVAGHRPGGVRGGARGRRRHRRGAGRLARTGHRARRHAPGADRRPGLPVHPVPPRPRLRRRPGPGPQPDRLRPQPASRSS